MSLGHPIHGSRFAVHLTGFLVALLLLTALAVPQSARAADPISIVDSAVVNEWPNQIVFTVQARAESEIRRVRLGYGVRFGSRAQQTMEFTPGREVMATLAIKTGQNNYVPPGSVFTYWFIVEDIAGNSVRTEERQFRYLDARFTWQSTTDGMVTVYFHDQGSRNAFTVLEVAQRAAVSVGRQTGGAITRPFTLVLYNSTGELDGALYIRDERLRGFAAGTANAPFDVILLGPNVPQALGLVVTHEVAHLSIHQAGDNTYLPLPAWLNEGLASSYEPGGGVQAQERMRRAVRENGVLPLARLAVFPSNRDDAELVYAQGLSFTRFLSARFGPDTNSNLLRAYGSGAGAEGPDGPWQRVFGKSLADLENDWRTDLGLSALPTPVPTVASVIQPAAPVPTYPPLVVPTFPREGATGDVRATLPPFVVPVAAGLIAVLFTLSLTFAIAAVILRRVKGDE